MREQLRTVYNVARDGGVGSAVGVITEWAFGTNIWIEYNKRREDSQFIRYQTNGITLFLDPDDIGISRELLVDGGWEKELTEELRRQLAGLRASSDSPLVALDIGANRGYYSFQMSDILGNDVQVYACEPAPKNFKALKRGLEENGFDNIVLDNVAIGSDDTKARLRISSHSNRHTLVDDVPSTHESLYTSEMEVNVLSVETYLRRHGLRPPDIDIVRMDVEGYEVEIFDGF